jgi:hypothetical protein
VVREPHQVDGGGLDRQLRHGETAARPRSTRGAERA